MFANRRGANAGWTRATLAVAAAAAIAANLGLPTAPRATWAAESDTTESESTLGAAVSTVTEGTAKAYRTVASGTAKAYNTVASGTSRVFRSTKETLMPWTSSDAQPAKKTVQRREPPPEKGEVIVKHWYEFWKAEPEVPPRPKTVQDFLNQPRLE
jgi:hypothetical protein